MHLRNLVNQRFLVAENFLRKILVFAVFLFFTSGAYAYIDMGTVEVMGKRYPRAGLNISNAVERIDSEDIDSANQQELSFLLEENMDININHSSIGGISGIAIRGVSGGQTNNKTNLVVDGVPIKTLRRGFILESIDVNAVEKIELLSGPSSLLYGGGALNGTVNIVTRIPDKKVCRVGTALGSFGTKKAAIYLQDRKDSFSYRINTSYLTTDGHLTDLSDEDEINPAEVINGGIMLEYGTGNNIFTLQSRGFMTERDEADFSNKTGEFSGIDTGISHIMGFHNISWQHDYDKSKSIIRLYTVNEIEKSDTLDEERALNIGGIFEYQQNIGEDIVVFTGFDYNNQSLEKTGDDETYYQKNFAPFIQLFLPLDLLKCEFTGGVRYDMNSEFKSEASPKAGVSYSIFPKVKLRGDISCGYRPPTVDELHSTNIKLFGDPDLKAEKSLNYETGLDYVGSAIDINITGYKMIVSDLIVSQPPATDEFYNGKKIKKKLKNIDGDSEYRGVELKTGIDLSRNFAYTFKYSYLDPDDLTFHTDRHKIKSLLGFKDSFQEYSVSVIHAAGRYLWDYEEGDRKDYTVLNLNCSWKIKDYIKFYVRVNNITDEEYIIYFYEPMPERNFMTGINYTF
jgi:outer membrane cobalamin receptor